MAWRCHGKTHKEQVDQLRKSGIIKSNVVYEAMLAVDRKDFCSSEPYRDSPQSIGSNATISAPHMHAYALENLRDRLHPGSKVLDVGCGSGYLAACMAIMVGESGRVVGIDHIPSLVEMSVNNTRKHHAALLDSVRLLYVEGDGREGYPDIAPYDCIHVGAAAPDIPTPLMDQLARGGRMVLPVGSPNATQKFIQIDRGQDGTVAKKNLLEVRYVPLTDKEKQVASWR
eukprot:sb/3469541/